jgi:succinate-semialdehyde dehydrogenase / glutarate-semialdehyde dehydrogenase
MMFDSIHPATDALLMQLPAHTAAQMDALLTKASTAQKKWALMPVAQRLPYLSQVAASLRAHAAHYAKLISLEVGKPITESLAEVEKCAWNFDFYASHAGAMLNDQVVASSASDSRIVYDPLGLVLAVMPWNYPFWQVMRAAAPVLAGGNGLVLKHASNVPQCALALQEVFAKAGLPEGLFTTLLTDSKAVAGLIADSRIHAVTFTGSTPVGRSIASQAGQALKKQVLELGGSDPFIVLADADVFLAAATAAKARFHNTGQSCISAKRFIVEEKIAQDFSDAFCAQVKKMRMGDPLDPTTQIGSMARRSLRNELHAQVEASIAQGAQLLMGGKSVAGAGAFYEPTVFDHVNPSMTVAKEETFGPAAAIIRVKTPEEAINVANATEFGLGAALWTTDLDRARQLSRRIEAGAVFINGMVASDPRLPFGGIKQSGYGRELGSHGLHEFTNIKTVWTGSVKA